MERAIWAVLIFTPLILIALMGIVFLGIWLSYGNYSYYSEEERYEMEVEPIWDSMGSTLETRSGSTEFEITDYFEGQLSSEVAVMQVFVDAGATENQEFRGIASAIGDINSKSDLSPDALVVEFFNGNEESTSAVLLDFRTGAAADAFNPGYSASGRGKGDGIYILTGDQLEGYPSGQGLFQAK